MAWVFERRSAVSLCAVSLSCVASTQAFGEPAPGLLHQAHPASNVGVVMGLAAYPNDIMGKFERFVGTLR